MPEFPSYNAQRALLWIPWTVTTLITSLRILVRVKLRNSGLDDYLITLALLCYTVSMASGQADLDSKNEDTVERAYFAAYIAGFFSLVISKIAIAVALLRLLGTVKDWRPLFLKINLGLFGVLSVLGLISTFTSPNCSHFTPPSGTYICVPWNRYVNVAFVAAWTIHSAFLDLAFSFIAIFTVYKLKLAMRKKVGLFVVFSLGCAACPFAILREFYDYTFFIPATTLEIALVHMGASIPTLMPLYELFKHGRPLTPRHGQGSGPIVPSGTDGRAHTTPSRLEASRRNADESTIELISVHTKHDSSH